MDEKRKDLQHPFQCQPGRENECSYFHSWLGGYVKCGLKESDPVHVNGPHLLTASNGEQAYCKGDTRACEFCARDVRAMLSCTVPIELEYMGSI